MHELSRESAKDLLSVNMFVSCLLGGGLMIYSLYISYGWGLSISCQIDMCSSGLVKGLDDSLSI